MKSKISYSKFSILITASLSILLFIGCIATVHDNAKFFVLLAAYLVLYVFVLLYGAAYIKADDNYIVLGSILKRKKIPMRDVESIEPFQPTMGAKRIFGSGGFMGYWGIFSEGDIGRYYGFFGKSSDCFLVRMKNGDKYVLGCDQPTEMINYIKSRIGK